LKAWCEAALAQGSVEENSGLGKAIRYYLSHYEGLTRLRLRPTSGVVLPEDWLRG
jgi:hypothetical protein